VRGEISHNDSTVVEGLIGELFLSFELELFVLDPVVPELLSQLLDLRRRSQLNLSECGLSRDEALTDGDAHNLHALLLLADLFDLLLCD
jgi:hypothetical protein